MMSLALLQWHCFLVVLLDPGPGHLLQDVPHLLAHEHSEDLVVHPAWVDAAAADPLVPLVSQPVEEP
uniref:Putative secreted protein n=1 Tax=Ixodes ricinus TaxID=34613 RepID=A0A6B0TQN0_IXORI